MYSISENTTYCTMMFSMCLQYFFKSIFRVFIGTMHLVLWFELGNGIVLPCSFVSFEVVDVWDWLHTRFSQPISKFKYVFLGTGSFNISNFLLIANLIPDKDLFLFIYSNLEICCNNIWNMANQSNSTPFQKKSVHYSTPNLYRNKYPVGKF